MPCTCHAHATRTRACTAMSEALARGTRLCAVKRVAAAASAQRPLRSWARGRCGIGSCVAVTGSSDSKPAWLGLGLGLGR
jgi:hypothetical protein